MNVRTVESQLDPGETAPSVVCLKNTYSLTINSDKNTDMNGLSYFSYFQIECLLSNRQNFCHKSQNYD